jgi:hypothetical protein
MSVAHRRARVPGLLVLGLLALRTLHGLLAAGPAGATRCRGHACLAWVTPGVSLGVALGAAVLVVGLAHRPAVRLGRVWALASAGPLAAWLAQVLIAGGTAGIAAPGSALVLAALVGGAVALVLTLLYRAVAPRAPAGRLGTFACHAAPAPALPGAVDVARLPALARREAGRAPPLAV